ncbi:hypothetical protein [Bacillus paramycoides]|uniref:hypothetical protein n=1 Tax=Bacillus paramycoides TaxID=2026194 RepID=UPI00380349AC
MKNVVNIGIFGIAFFWLLQYFLKQSEKREDGYKEEINRGEKREEGYRESIKQNQEVIKESQAKSLETVEEIKMLIKKGDVQ